MKNSFLLKKDIHNHANYSRTTRLVQHHVFLTHIGAQPPMKLLF